MNEPKPLNPLSKELKIMKAIIKITAVLAVLVGFSTANAATIYQNTTTDLNLRFSPGFLEVGDEITFAGDQRVLSGFSFEYFGLSSTPGAFAGTVEARIRFYQNNGNLFNGYASPSSLLYDSQWFSITPSDRATLVFAPGADNVPLSLALPDSMTFSVQFQGMGTGDLVGVDLYGPPGVGSSFADYWLFESGSWSLKENAAGDVNFALEIQAVPEPSVLALLLGAGITVFLARRRA